MAPHLGLTEFISTIVLMKGLTRTEAPDVKCLTRLGKKTFKVNKIHRGKKKSDFAYDSVAAHAQGSSPLDALVPLCAAI